MTAAQAWAKEPWTENIFVVRDGDGNVIWLVGWPIFRPKHFLSFENRRRAFACVNALDGIPKPEGIRGLIEAGREIAKLAQSHVDDLSCYATEGGCLNCAMRQDTMDKWHDSLRACGIEP